MKTICLDYDGSYTAFPELFNMIINRRKELGYNVILATMRYPSEANDALRNIANEIDVYYTGRKAKKEFLEVQVVFPDLWLDACPYWILNDAAK